MSIKKQLKNIVISLYKIVEGESAPFIKKYSIIENQFGTQLQLFVFKNCTGCNLASLEIIANGLQNEFLKDLLKNEYVDIDRVIVPQVDDMNIYGGKNQAYIGFSKIAYSKNIDKAIEQFKKYGYKQLFKQLKNY